MNTIPGNKSSKQEKTLLAALLLSMWAPLATGIAVMMSRSSTQVADFIRRTVELVALFISWYLYRYICRRELTTETKTKLENIASLSVAIAMGCSGLIMLILALIRLNTSFTPGGNVYPGLGIAILGAITNGWFWRRYTFLNQEQHDTIIEAQRQLYRAKTFVDLCVITALSTVAFFPGHAATRYVDLLGTFAVSAYLLWSSFRSARSALMCQPTQEIKPLDSL
jgi:divalent metal cation (Fe/Co/Zn/Cd) transporter